MPIANADAIQAREQWLQHNSLVTSLLGLHGRWTAVSPGVLIGIADHDHHPDHHPDHQYFVRRTETATAKAPKVGRHAHRVRIKNTPPRWSVQPPPGGRATTG